MDALRSVTRKTQLKNQYFVNDEKTEFQKLHLLDAQGLENVMQPGEFSLQTFKHRIIYLYLATNS